MKEKNQQGIVSSYCNIDDEELFPRYRQHLMYKKINLLCCKKGLDCQVGCGSVAWAMLFGYLNRRSCAKPLKYGEGGQYLFTLDDNQPKLSRQRAPEVYNEDVVKYTEMLHSKLGTLNIMGHGSTPPNRMQRISDFFRANHRSGNPRIITHLKGVGSLIGNYNDDIRDAAIGYIKNKWPVVVGIRVNNKRFGMHYGVATRYRETQFKSQEYVMLIDREFYVYQGFGRTGEWVPAELFFAGVAMY